MDNLNVGDYCKHIGSAQAKEHTHAEEYELSVGVYEIK